jgi:RNA polymerase sigma-70 factor, ECF subfamily
VSTSAHLLGPSGAGDRREEDLSDDEIVERVRRGRAGDFEILVRRHNRRMFRAVRSVIRDSVAAEDVIQDAYIKGYTRLDQYRGPASVGAWLARIALHEAQSWVRKSIAPPPSEAAVGVDPSADPERQASRDQLVRALEQAVDRLPADFRGVFILRAIEELSTYETAYCLDIAEATVKTRLHRARKLLLADLGQEYGSALHDVLAFAGSQCQRITSGVLARLPRLR